jgi:hypothetical protein
MRLLRCSRFITNVDRLAHLVLDEVDILAHKFLSEVCQAFSFGMHETFFLLSCLWIKLGVSD